MVWGAGKDKKVKEAWPIIATGSAEVANKGVDRTVFTKVFQVHTSHSSEAANGCRGGLVEPSAGYQAEIPSGRQKGAVFLQGMSSREKFCSSGWTSTIAKLLPPVSPLLPPSSLSPVLQPPGAAALPLGSSPGLEMGCCLAWQGQFYYQSDSLPRRLFTPWLVKVTTGGRTPSRLGFTQDPVTDRSALLPPIAPTSPSHAFCSLLPQHSHAAQTAARYYSVVAWIPLNACQSAQRAESELFKLHLLKDPWCLFLLFVFSNSLKS